MLSNVTYKNKFYGNYPCEDFTVEVGYCSDFRHRHRKIDFEKYHEFSKKLEDILLGQISPVEIRWTTIGEESIVYKGEKIAKLHLKTIKEHWRHINFKETPWSKEIEELKWAHRVRQWVKKSHQLHRT